MSNYKEFQEWLDNCPVKIKEYDDYDDTIQVIFQFATEKEDTMSTYEKLNCIHIALQELQNEFNIPDDNSDWYDAISLTEEIREGCRQNEYR